MTRPASENVLVVNPGSTSTKVALFQGDILAGEASLPAPEMASASLWEEFPGRLKGIRRWMEKSRFRTDDLDGVVGRGGLFRPMAGGTYQVTEAMLADARSGLQGIHASNLGCALARALADEATRMARTGAEAEGRPSAPDRAVPAFIMDPVSTDEFGELARLSGLRDLPRRSLSHALSIHALVRRACERDGRALEDSRFVVAHLGGGISVCPVAGGRILDANNANSGGPFSPTRAGGLPTQELLELAFGGSHTLESLLRLTLKEGGLLSYLGTADAREVERRMESGDEEARRVYEAMAYQIAKEIGAMATVLHGRVDRILLTGGLAASKPLMEWVRERVGFIAPVEVWPEVEEMRALAEGALRVLRGDEKAKEY